jgi:Arc/MetJ family transcription regulator
LLDLDDDLLAEATTALGTSTKQDTVTKALRAATEASRAGRERALTDLQQVAAEGGFDFDLLEEFDR